MRAPTALVLTQPFRIADAPDARRPAVATNEAQATERCAIIGAPRQGADPRKVPR